MPGWMNHKLVSTFLGEISTIHHLRYADDSTLMAESEEELKSLLITLKEESKKSGLNSFKPASRFKNEDYGIRSHHFMANRWKTMETVTDFILWAPKSLQMMTAAMILKTLTPWKESYDQPR